jgi:hypothetical protein
MKAGVARLRRAADFAETRGRPGLALGRGTPGLRTLTVIAAGVSGLNGRRALPGLTAPDPVRPEPGDGQKVLVS